MRYDVYLMKKEALDGMTADEAVEAVKNLKEQTLYPLEIGGELSYAVGFLTTAAAELLDFEYAEPDSAFACAVRVLLEEPGLTRPDCTYQINGLNVYLRDLPA